MKLQHGGSESALLGVERHRWEEDEYMTRRKDTQSPPPFSCLHKYLPQVKSRHLAVWLLWQVHKEPFRGTGFTGFPYKLFKDSKGSGKPVPSCGRDGG